MVIFIFFRFLWLKFWWTGDFIFKIEFRFLTSCKGWQRGNDGCWTSFYYFINNHLIIFCKRNCWKSFSCFFFLLGINFIFFFFLFHSNFKSTFGVKISWSSNFCFSDFSFEKSESSTFSFLILRITCYFFFFFFFF